MRRLALLAALPLATANCTLQAAAPPRPPSTASATPTPAQATPTPTPTSSTSPPTTPTPAPAGTPTPDWWRFSRLVTFQVAGEDGEPVDDATVRIRSLDDHLPFDVTVQGQAGTWEPVRVPMGVQLELAASRPGWASRRRVAVLDDRDMRPTIDYTFGHQEGADAWDFSNAAFFLSDHPEVARIEPAAGTFTVDPTDGVHVVDTPRVAVVLTFSEPFDEATRRRLAAAVRLWPADDASGNAYAIDVGSYAGTDEGDGLAGLDLDFRPGATSLPAKGAIHMGLDGRARTSWDAEGRTLTFAVDGPMGEVEKALRYQVGLVSDGEPFADSAGHVLGTDHAGLRDGHVSVGRLLANTIAGDSARLFALWPNPEAVPPGAERRWNATHTSTYGFRVRLGIGPSSQRRVTR